MYLSGLLAAAATVLVAVGGRFGGGTVVVGLEVEKRRPRTACLCATGLEWKACTFDDWWGRKREKMREERNKYDKGCVVTLSLTGGAWSETRKAAAKGARVMLAAL